MKSNQRTKASSGRGRDRDRGRGRGIQGRGGREGKITSFTKKSFGVDTEALVTTKRGNDQRSPFEGDLQRKKHQQ